MTFSILTKATMVCSAIRTTENAARIHSWPLSLCEIKPVHYGMGDGSQHEIVFVTLFSSQTVLSDTPLRYIPEEKKNPKPENPLNFPIFHV